MSSTGFVAAGVLLLTGLPIATGVSYLLLLVVASRFDRSPRTARPPRSRLIVVVPAHDEAASIEPCVAGLLAQRYPTDLRRIVVVADNCRDETADIASAAGAEIWTRDDQARQGKGYALRWAIDRILAMEPAEALVVVDADARTDPDLLCELERWLRAGYDAVQADYVVEPDVNTPRAHLEAAAVLLRNRVRGAGLQALALSGGLTGSGMLFSRHLLLAHPWEAFSTTEDAEYGLQLMLTGVRPAFARHAHLTSPTTPSSAVAHTQGVRWETGRFSRMFTQPRRLLKAAVHRRDLRLLVAAFDMALPPFTTLSLIAVAGAAGSTVVAALGLMPWFGVASWVLAAGLLPIYTVGGLLAARAPRSTYVALLFFPWFVFRKLRVYAHVAGRGAETREWVRTKRRAEIRRGKDG